MTDKHVRQQVREAVTAALETIDGFAAKVFPARVHPFRKDDLPAIVVKTGNEVVEKAVASHMNGIQKRWIETEVYVFTRDQINIEDAIDDLAMKVEKKIFENSTLSGLVAETELVEITPATGGEPDAPTGAHLLRFVSLAFTKQGAPQKSITNNRGGQSEGIFT